MALLLALLSCSAARSFKNVVAQRATRPSGTPPCGMGPLQASPCTSCVSTAFANLQQTMAFLHACPQKHVTTL